ncbi:hypothetical protein RUND412_007019 [Rhizina undulata]
MAGKKQRNVVSNNEYNASSAARRQSDMIRMRELILESDLYKLNIVGIKRSAFQYFAVTFDTTEHAEEATRYSNSIMFRPMNTDSLDLLPEEQLVVKMLSQVSGAISGKRTTIRLRYQVDADEAVLKEAIRKHLDYKNDIELKRCLFNDIPTDVLLARFDTIVRFPTLRLSVTTGKKMGRKRLLGIKIGIAHFNFQLEKRRCLFCGSLDHRVFGHKGK